MALRRNPVTGALEDDGIGGGLAPDPEPIEMAPTVPPKAPSVAPIPFASQIAVKDEPLPQGFSSGDGSVDLGRKATGIPARAPAPSGGGAPAGVVTDFSGGMGTAVPLGSGEPVVKDSTTEKRSEKYKTQSAEERAAAVEQAKADQDREKALREQAAADVEKAHRESLVANYKAKLAEETDLRQQILQRKKEDALALKSAEVARREQEYNRVAEDPTGTWWKDGGLQRKLLGGIALIAGVIGGLKDGSNVGAEKISEAIADNLDRKKSLFDLALKNKTITGEEFEKRQQDLELRHVSMLNAAIAKGEAFLKQQGASEAQIAGNTGIALLRKEIADRKQRIAEGLRHEVEKEHSSTHVDIDGAAAGGAGAGKMSDGAIVRAEADRALMERAGKIRALIEKNPQVYASMQAKLNAARKGQGLGLGKVVADDTLMNPAERDLYRRLSEARSIYQKALDIGSSDQDAKNAEVSLGFTTLEPRQMVQRLGEMERDSSGRIARAVGGGRAQVAAVTGGAPAAPRAGKVNGKLAWIYPDGHWEPR